MFAEIIFQFHNYSFIPTSECERNRKFVTDCVRACVRMCAHTTDDVASLLFVGLGLRLRLVLSRLDMKCEYVCACRVHIGRQGGGRDH